MFSLLLTSFACNTESNVNVENTPVSTEENSFNSLSTAKKPIDDSEMGGGKKNNAFTETKIINESILKDKNSLIFKIVKIAGKTSSKQKNTSLIFAREDKFNVSGTINYYDDKGRLKAGESVTVTLVSNGQNVGTTLTDENGFWAIGLDKAKFTGKAVTPKFEFGNKYWSIGGKGNYQWQGAPITSLSGDVDTGVLAPVKDSESAKTAFIHDIFLRYTKFFKKEGIDISTWWKKPIKTVWPGSGNYYSWGTLNVTHADHWDVNGHELGHAITDIGTNSQMGGGQHKIDECYERTIAWSEGFATFLSGVVSLDKAEEDARFEFLVPRRAPIRIENVPDDVCKGQNNEWRVSAALWDLYDAHNDGEDSVSVPFKLIWQALSRPEKSIGSMKDAADSLRQIAPQEYHQTIDSALTHNTMF